MSKARGGKVQRVECKRCGTPVSASIARANDGHCRKCATSPEVVLRNRMWAAAGGAALCLVAGVVLFLWFHSLEQEGGRVRVNAVVALLYHTLGKVGTLALFLLLSAVSAWRAVAARRALNDCLRAPPE